MVEQKMYSKLKDKHVFFDIDGTLAEYRFNDHVFGQADIGGQTHDEIMNERIFTKSRPLKTMQNLIRKLAKNGTNLYVLGAKEMVEEVEQKHEWLDLNYPQIVFSNRLFVDNSEEKVDALIEFAEFNKIDRNDIVFIDDLVKTLWLVESAGFNAYHISSFIE